MTNKVLDKSELQSALNEMADKIYQQSKGQSIVLIGIHTRGIPIAKRLEKLLQSKIDSIETGTLDITLYRDDLSEIADHPVIRKSDITFSLDSKTVFLIDDVLYTGRTIRSALNALFDLGRPSAVRLAVLVDRGGRELPIQADICGLHYAAQENDNIHVKLLEVDGEDCVELASK